MPLPTFGKRNRCPICSTTLPDPASEEFHCPRCSAHLWHIDFPSAGLRFLVTQPRRSLDDVLLDMAKPHNPDLVHFLRIPSQDLDADSLDNLELRLELLEDLERHLPELSD